jgi:hypothetical protein
MPFWKTIQDHLIGSITAGGLVLVAPGAYWVDLHKEKILDWVAGVQIEVSSTNRPSVSSFIAGEEIRFSLKGVESDKVFWFLARMKKMWWRPEAQRSDIPFNLILRAAKMWNGTGAWMLFSKKTACIAPPGSWFE